MSYLNKMDIKFVTCPFNKQHRVQEYKLQYHISRCQKNYPDYDVCPYNACHRMPKDEFHAHVDICPNKQILKFKPDPDLNKDEDVMSITEKLKTQRFNYELGENWDE